MKRRKTVLLTSWRKTAVERGGKHYTLDLIQTNVILINLATLRSRRRRRCSRSLWSGPIRAGGKPVYRNIETKFEDWTFFCPFLTDLRYVPVEVELHDALQTIHLKFHVHGPQGCTATFINSRRLFSVSKRDKLEKRPNSQVCSMATDFCNGAWG
jgi:hypothetical protein